MVNLLFVLLTHPQQTMFNLLRAKIWVETSGDVRDNCSPQSTLWIYEYTTTNTPPFVLSPTSSWSMNSFLLLVLLALKRTAFLQDRRSRTSLIPAQRRLLTLLNTFTAVVHTMASKRSHNRITSHPSSLIDSSAILFLDHGIFQARCGTVNTTAHPLPSRSHLSCLAVCETQSFLLIPHCQEGADGRCALPIILFLWYPACWQHSGSNIWRQEFAVYFQFWVTELKDSMGYRERKKGLYWIGADRFL